MRIAVDAMGGDHAPAEIVKGAARAAAKIAPELPAEAQPSTLPSAQSRAQTFIEASRFWRTAWAG